MIRSAFARTCGSRALPGRSSLLLATAARRTFAEVRAPRPQTAGAGKDLMTKLLRHVGSKKEVEQYLEKYSKVEAKRFALIKVGGDVLREDRQTLSSALSFLSEAGLYPVVLIGAAPQINQALAEANLPSEKVDGLRVTSPEVLYVARKVFLEESQKLAHELEENNTRVRRFSSGVFDCSLLDESKYGLVGKVDQVNASMIADSVASGYIPVIPSLGETLGGQILNLNADGAAASLALALGSEKVVFLTSQGGLVNEADELIKVVDLSEDYDTLMQQSWLDDKDKLKLSEVKTLLQQLPSSSTATIVDALQLPRELFTHEGAGTLVRLNAEPIFSHSSLQNVDLKRVFQLIEKDFGAAPGEKVREEWVEYSGPNVLGVYHSENYTAVAVVTKGVDGAAYLDKFAVDNINKNETLANNLLKQVLTDHPKLYWRSKPKFEKHAWFYQQAAGSLTKGEWTIFWAGFDDMAFAEKCVQAAVAVPKVLSRST